MGLVELKTYGFKCDAGTYGAWCSTQLNTGEHERVRAGALAREAGWVVIPPLGFRAFCPEHAPTATTQPRSAQ